MIYSFTSAQNNCSYNFKGLVFDSITNTQLEAIIIFPEKNKTVFSNTSIGFSIDSVCVGSYEYYVELLGYKTIKATVYIPQTKKLDIYLAPATIDLKTFTKVEHKREEIEALNKIVLKDIELTKAQGTTLGEGLKSISGVNILSTGSNIVKPVIHGMHSNRILILNNGVRQEGQNWGSEHAPEIDTYLATSLSVIKGANAVRYGSDAIAGVILVEPKKLNDINKLGGEINMVGFSNGIGAASSGIIEYSPKKINAIKARVQGTMRKMGNVHTPNYILSNTGVIEKNYSAAFGYVKENYGVELFRSSFNTEVALFKGSHIGNLTDLDYAFTQAKPRKEFIDSFTYKIDRPKQLIVHELNKANAYYFSPRLGKFTFVYAYQTNKRSEFDAHRQRNNYEAAKNKPELQFNLTTQTADFIWEHHVIRGFSGSVGFTGLWQNNYYEGRNLIPNFLMQSYGAFAIEHFTKNKTEFEFGIRYDVRQMSVVKRRVDNSLYQPRFNYNVPSATFGIVHNGDKYLIKGYVGSAFRAPAINELFINGVHHGSAKFEIGDEGLKPEKAFNSSINLIYNANKIVSLQVEAYNNYIIDFIYQLPQKPPVLTVLGAFPTFVYKQTNARLTGLDAEVTIQIRKNINLTSKASLLYARNLQTNSWIELMPANRFDNTLKIALPKKYLVEFGAVYTQRQNRTNDNVDYAPAPKAYTLFNLNLVKSFTIKKTKMTTIIGGNNLLNTVYRDYMNSFRYYADDLGRNIYIKIKFNF